MIASEAYQKSKTWKKRVQIIATYHFAMNVRRGGKWSMRKTAKYFAISLGAVSEAVKLMEHYEVVKPIKRRCDALELIRSSKNARQNCQAK